MTIDGYLRKDTEHVFGVFECDSQPSGMHKAWVPAWWCWINGEEQMVPISPAMGTAWATEPKLVRIDDIAHLLTSAQLAEMRRPIGAPGLPEPERTSRWKVLMQ